MKEPNKGLNIKSKESITTLSIISSAGLAILKFAIGIFTGSLGLIAEGMHSLLDLLSTIVTFVAVRIGARPPDANHPYGHERAESLGALAGMALLGATALIILYHAVIKILYNPGAPEVNIWSFAIIIISVIVDFLRVRSLKKAAAHYNSQALASDAEHFSNDMLGSLSVLAGLICIYLSAYLPIPRWFVDRADAIASLGVVLIAFKSVIGIGGQAIKSLMDDIPENLVPRIEKVVSTVNGVVSGTTIARARIVGNKTFVDITVGTQRHLSFGLVHQLTEEIEKSVQLELGGEVEVLVHPEPTGSSDEPYNHKVRAIAQKLGMRIHNLNIFQLEKNLRIELDLELADQCTIREALEKSRYMERILVEEIGKNTKIAIHVEPRNEILKVATRRPSINAQINEALVDIAEFDRVSLEDAFITEEGLAATLHAGINPDAPLIEAHSLMHNLERKLREAYPSLDRVHICMVENHVNGKS